MLPLANSWRLNATVRVTPAAVNVIDAAFAFVKAICRLPAALTLTSAGLKLAPTGKLGALNVGVVPLASVAVTVNVSVVLDGTVHARRWADQRLLWHLHRLHGCVPYGCHS